jgi:hypothetical protein
MSKTDDVAKKARDAVLAFLNGETDHVQLVRTKDGEHVMRWTREQNDQTDASSS